MLSVCAMKKVHFLKWGRRVARQLLFCCGRRRGGSNVLRRIFWRLRSQWKRANLKKRSSGKYSYDIHSYSMNFDDGCSSDEHVSPLAPTRFCFSPLL